MSAVYTPNIDTFFYLQDAGETYAILPILERLDSKGSCKLNNLVIV